MFALVAGTAHRAVPFEIGSIPDPLQKEQHPGGGAVLFGAGYGNRTRLHGLGSRCITDIRTLRYGVGGIIADGNRKIKGNLTVGSLQLTVDSAGMLTNYGAGGIVPGGNAIPSGSSGKSPLRRLLWVLSCRNKKVPPPAGTSDARPYLLRRRRNFTRNELHSVRTSLCRKAKLHEKVKLLTQ